MEDKVKYEEAKHFIEENPQVWDMFVSFTFDAMKGGLQKYSAYAIFERLRWEMDVVQKRNGKFKLNNNFRPYFARRFMEMFPEHTGFFETRTR